MATNQNRVEKKLAKALAELKPFLLKRSWISVSQGSEIGAGGYGTVHRGVLRKGTFASRTIVAVKKLYTPGEQSRRVEVALALVRELRVQSTLNHPNVLPLLGFYLSKTLEEAWLVSPYAINGNLYDYLERVNPDMETRLEFARDTANGLCYLHTRVPPICHGDIKILNILVAADKHAILCDFGLSKCTEATSVMTGNNGGTARYWSPELLTPGNHPTLESDVWAWGCLLLEIVTGLAPYHDNPLEGRVIHQITENVQPAPLDTLECPSHVRDLLAGCWQAAPDARPSMRRALEYLSGKLLSSSGYLHQLSSISSSQGPSARNGVLEALERELIQVIEPLERLRIKPARLEFPRSDFLIGVGGCGTVYQAVFHQGARGNQDTAVAVKKLRANGGRDKCLRMVTGLIRELAVWATLSHQNIIPLVGFHLGEQLDQAWLISPYMANGCISAYLLRVQASEQHRLDLALDTANGLNYLHGLNPPICHGDIKALNVLITDQKRAVLCDLGLARAIEAMPSGLTTSTFNQGGSLPYESPELLLGTSKRSPSSDVWAWGCLLQEIFSGKGPYHWANNPGAIVKWIIQDIPPAVADEITCPGHVRTLLSYCWRFLPDARPSMTQCATILSSPGEMPAISRQLKKGYDYGRAIALERFELIFSEEDNIGSGEFGAVYRARLVIDSTTSEAVVAVKKLFPPSDNSLLHSGVLEKVSRWSEFTHTKILQIAGYYPAIPNPLGEILLAFPYVSNGNLATHLNQSLEYSRKISLANDITQGLLYLHTRTPPVCHGRLHPNNVFVMPGGHAVIGDYDFEGLMVGSPSAANTPPAGLRRYQSPEQLTKTSEPGISNDVWAFGCVFLKIVTGRLPYQGTSDVDLVKALHQGSLPAPIDDLDYPPRAQNILGICWRLAPETRPGISEIAAVLSGRLWKFEQAWSIPVNGTVRCLRFSYCSKYLVVGFVTHIGIYESENGRLFCELSVPSEPLWVQMSHSRKLLVASFRIYDTYKGDPSIRLWDLETQKLIATFEGHSKPTWALGISPDDRFVVSGSYDRTICVWPIGGNDVIPLASHRTGGPVAFLNIHHAFPAPAISFWDNKTSFMDPVKGTIIATLDHPDQTDTFWTLRFSSDLQRLYGAMRFRGIFYWEVGDLLQPMNAPTKDRHLQCNKLVDSPGDGTLAITASMSRVVFISRSGRVNAINLDSSPNHHETVGAVSTVSDTNQVDMSQVSEDGIGLVVGNQTDSQNLIVYRYQPWDKPGAWKS